MSNEIIVPMERFEFTSTALVMHTPTLEEWVVMGAQLQHVQGSLLWWLGDWARQGEQEFGEAFAQGVYASGYTEKTIRNAMSVCKHIPPSRRREKLSFSHHAEVAYLEEDQQETWLDIAEREEWSRNELRLALHAGERVERITVPVAALEELGRTLDGLLLERLSEQARHLLQKAKGLLAMWRAT
jgi:hypothetical protein